MSDAQNVIAFAITSANRVWRDHNMRYPARVRILSKHVEPSLNSSSQDCNDVDELLL
jgi:hypothetical protein